MMPRGFSLLLAGMLLGGCAASVNDPLQVMLDREADYSRRRIAMRQAAAELTHDPARRAALWRLVWEHGYPAWQRIEAIDQLRRLDESQLRSRLSVGILQLPDRSLLEHVIALAAESGWREFTIPLIRAWGRPMRAVPDADRPERAALETLHPGWTAEQILLAVVAGSFSDPLLTDTGDIGSIGPVMLAHQVAAWDVLNRLVDRPPADLLDQLPPAAEPSVLGHALRFGRDELAIIPTTREEVLWLLDLLDEHDRDRQAWWREAAHAVQQLDQPQRTGLQLRHLPFIAAAGEDHPAWQMSSEALVTQIETRLAHPQGRHRQPTTHAAELNDPARPIRHWGNRLTWADLLVVVTLLDALEDASLAASLFRQAEADLADTRTEYGGVIVREAAGGYRAQMHEPIQFRGDHVFIPPQPMIEQLYTGLFHYHFHAQQYTNTRHAAPGPGDLRLAERLRFNFVVLTFIDAETINVDYHQPGGVVIDLGTIHRSR